jgi:hypothetical protein
MDGTVKVPGIGPVGKRTLALTGAGAAALLLVLIVRRKNAAPAAPAAGPADPAGSAGTVDPATGYAYGSAEDQAALAAQGTAAPYDTSGLGTGLGGYYYGLGGSTQAVPPGPGNFADNAEWSQYALAYMTGTLNADPSAAGAALGAYLGGQPVTSGQRVLVEEAIAVAGHPPQAGPGGYPPGIRLQAPHHGGPQPGGEPRVWDARAVSVSRNRAEVAWKASGATSFRVTLHGPGRENGRTGTVRITRASYGGLEAGRAYEVTIEPLKAGRPSGSPATVTFTTRR